MSLYDILNVPRRATRAEIEKSYRSLARSHYPNHNKPNSSDFVEVNKAYTILKDKHKRDFYDMFGAMSIELLLHNKDSYILTRIFDRLNIYLYLTAFSINLSTFLALPFLVGSRDRYGIGYTSMVSPFGIAGAVIIIPIVRSLLALYGVYGMGSELRSMIFGSCEILVSTLHVFNCAVYFDRFVNSIFISIAILLVLEALSLVGSLYYQAGSEKLIVTSKKDIFIGKSIRLAILILLICSIPSFTKPLLCMIQIIWAFRIPRRPIVLAICVLIPPLLYVATYSLVLAGFTNFFVYIPLLLLIALIVLNLGYALSAVISNIPKSKYDRREILPLPYYEEVV